VVYHRPLPIGREAKVTKRYLDDDFWSDSFVETLPCKVKLFYIYLFTNKSVRPGGIYELTPRKIAFETGLDETEISTYFEAVKDKVAWHPQTGFVWIKNFVIHQCNNPNWADGALKSIMAVAPKDKELALEALCYLKDKIQSYPLKERFGEGFPEALKGSIEAFKSSSYCTVLYCTDTATVSVKEVEDKQGEGERKVNPTPYQKAHPERYPHLFKKEAKA